MRKSTLVAAGIAALLIPAATSQAATKQVTIGPAKPLAGVPPAAVDADFYPRTITIAKGDHIRFKWTTGFGDVIFVPKGQVVPSIAAPRPDKPIAGAKDAAGNDMWFNGRPNLSPNIPALSPQGGTTIDGSKVVSSGFALDGLQKPWKVRFTKAGRYTLGSVFHPAKTLHVAVKQSRKGVPTAAQDKRALAKQVKASTRLAKTLAKNGFAQSFLGEVFQPFVLNRSDAPGTATSYDGTNHGNGYFNTGILDTDAGSAFPSHDAVTFTTAGTYRFYCAVHGNEMTGEIVVQ